MDRELQPLKRQPFQDSVDTAFFFPGGGRRKIVDEIKSALSSSVSLLLVTGAEGTGKTMVCRMVEKELPDGMISVFLPEAINSFDDMVQIVLEEISPVLAGDSLPADTTLSPATIASLLQEHNLRLVIFFDEAEKIFLATLERVRRLLDQVNQEQTVLQFVFSADESFQDNLKQLSMVTFSDIKELRLKLEPLNEEESCQYLNHCLKVAAGVDEPVFSQDLVSKISSSGITFTRLNHFAVESFQAGRLDTSFLGLLDTEGEKEGIKPRQEAQEWVSSKPLRTKELNLEFLSLKKILPGWILYGGGASVIIVLLFFWFGRTGDNEQIKETTAEVPIIELKRVVPKIQPSVQQALIEKEKEAAPATQTDVEVMKEPVKTESEKTGEKQPLQSSGNSSRETVAESKVPGTDLAPDKKQELPEKQITPDPVGIEGVAAAIDKKIENKQEEPREKVEENKAGVTTNVMVEPLEETEKPFSPEVIKETKLPDVPRLAEPVVIIDDEKKFRESQESREKAAAQVVPEGTLSDLSDKEVNALFLKRIAAGARWLVGGGSGKYTIQLMVLTSVQAEKGLKQMLRTVEYQSVADQLYVLRRTGPDPTVMVFYGEYPNLAAARNGRNNLPVFLRKHDPYAISVFGAVEKATSPQ